MSKDNLIDEIKASKGYDICLSTTFNFDIAFFERFIKSTLFDNDIKKITLFVDSKELNKALKNVDGNSHLGLHYVVCPIEMRSSFHPKITLFLGKDKAKIIVASANYTTSGYCINDEVFNVIEMDYKDGKNRDVVLTVIDFFLCLDELSVYHDNDVFKEVLEYKKGYSLIHCEENEVKLIHNLEKTMIESISETITNAIHIDIAVPYYDNEAKALFTLSSIYPNAKFNLYLQDKQCRFPVNYIKSDKINIIPFNGFHDRKKNKNFYHGKVFRFITPEKKYILYGSANCTLSALCKTINTDGNIECCLLQEDSNDDSDLFFNNFALSSIENFKCETLKYKTNQCDVFYFRYGILENENIILIIGTNNKSSSFQISFNGHELLWTSSPEGVKVSVPCEIVSLTNIFDLDIAFDGNIQTVKCWYLNPLALSITRNAAKINRINIVYDPSSTGDKYAEEQTELYRNLMLNSVDYRNQQITMNSIKREKNIAIEDEDSGEYFEGVIDYVIPPADYLDAIKRDKQISEIKAVCYKSFFNSNRASSFIHKAYREKSENKTIVRNPTTSETRLGHFVHKMALDFTDLRYIEMVDFEHYFSCVIIFMTTYEKHLIDEPLKNVYDTYKSCIDRVNMMWNLVYLTESSNKKIYDVLELVVRMILINKFFVNLADKDRREIERKERDILFELQKLTDIRVYSCQIAYAKGQLVYGLDPLTSNNYITDIWGSLTYVEIEQQILKEVGNNACITDENDELKIYLQVDSLKQYFTYTFNSLFEINRYNGCHKKWKKIRLIFDINEKNRIIKLNESIVKIEYVYTTSISENYKTEYTKSGKKTKYLLPSIDY